MPGANLTTASQIQCPHGGQATLITTNVHAQAGAAMLLESDVHVVAGCPFTIGTKYSPCVRIEWSAGATKVTAGGVAVLTSSSVGKCYSPESAPQGVALVVNTQNRVTSE